MAKRRPCTHADYARLFVGDPLGSRIIEELVALFCIEPFVPGGLEAERMTTLNIGRRQSIDYILSRIEKSRYARPDANADTNSYTVTRPATDATGDTDA